MGGGETAARLFAELVMGKKFSSRLRALRGIDRTGGHLPPQQKQRWERQQQRKREKREERERMTAEPRIEAVTGTASASGGASAKSEP